MPGISNVEASKTSKLEQPGWFKVRSDTSYFPVTRDPRRHENRAGWPNNRENKFLFQAKRSYFGLFGVLLAVPSSEADIR